jgi:hypothetical protein
MKGEPVSVTVDIEHEDVTAFLAYFQAQMYPWWMMQGFWLTLGLAVVALFSLWRDNPVAAIVISVAAGFVAVLGIRSRRIWRLQRVHFGLRTYAITEDALTVLGNGWNTRVEWRCLQSVAETSGHIVIMWDPVYGYVVPKRAFPTPEAAAQFFGELKRRIDEAQLATHQTEA